MTPYLAFNALMLLVRTSTGTNELPARFCSRPGLAEGGAVDLRRRVVQGDDDDALPPPELAGSGRAAGPTGSADAFAFGVVFFGPVFGGVFVFVFGVVVRFECAADRGIATASAVAARCVGSEDGPDAALESFDL